MRIFWFAVGLAVVLILILSVFDPAGAQECKITGFSSPYLKSWSRTEYLVWWEYPHYPLGLQPGLATGKVTFEKSTLEGVAGRVSDIPFKGYACNGKVAWWIQAIDFNKLPCGNWTAYDPIIAYENWVQPIEHNPDIGFRFSQILGCNLFQSILFKNYP
jgi:hypothetical protein